MEITVKRQDMLQELIATQGVVERKATIPILSNMLFEATEQGLTISATDLDLSMRTFCPATVKRTGTCTVPARKLYDYVKLLAEGDLSLKLLENNWIQIRAGRSHTKMVGMVGTNYPKIPVFPTAGLCRIPVPAFKVLVNKTIYAISCEESRYVLNGALMLLKPDSLAMVWQRTDTGLLS